MQKAPAAAMVPTPVLIPGLEGGLHLQVSWRRSKEGKECTFTPEFMKNVGQTTDLHESSSNSTTATEGSAVVSEPRNGSKMSCMSSESTVSSELQDSCWNPSEPTLGPDFKNNDKEFIPRLHYGMRKHNPEMIEEIPLEDQLVLQSGDLRAYAKRPVGGLLPSLLEPRKKTMVSQFGSAKLGRVPVPEKHQQAWTLS